MSRIKPIDPLAPKAPVATKVAPTATVTAGRRGTYTHVDHGVCPACYRDQLKMGVLEGQAVAAAGMQNAVICSGEEVYFCSKHRICFAMPEATS